MSMSPKMVELLLLAAEVAMLNVLRRTEAGDTSEEIEADIKMLKKKKVELMEQLEAL